MAMALAAAAAAAAISSNKARAIAARWRQICAHQDVEGGNNYEPAGDQLKRAISASVAQTKPARHSIDFLAAFISF